MKDIEFAGQIVEGLLVPSCNTPGDQFHEKWKPVNRAAGVIVGRALSEVYDGYPLAEAPKRAEEVTQKVLNELSVRIEDRKTVEMISQGLCRRVAETLVAMGC